jgi:hypothetical protein
MSTPVIPTTEPATLTAGMTWIWQKPLADYPANTWTLAYALTHSNGASGRIAITAGSNGTSHEVNVSAANTANYTPGTYSLLGYVSDGTDKFVVSQATISLRPNPATTAAFDSRSLARKTFEALEQSIHGLATAEMQDMSVNGKSLRRMSLPEKMQAYQYFKALVEQEDARAAAAAGAPSSSLRVQFTRP